MKLDLPTVASATFNISVDTGKEASTSAVYLVGTSPVIELVYGPSSLMAVMVQGRLSAEDMFKLLKLLPKAKHSKTTAREWGLDVLFYDPHWTVPADRPKGQRIAFLPPA